MRRGEAATAPPLAESNPERRGTMGRICADPPEAAQRPSGYAIALLPRILVRVVRRDRTDVAGGGRLARRGGACARCLAGVAVAGLRPGSRCRRCGRAVAGLARPVAGLRSGSRGRGRPVAGLARCLAGVAVAGLRSGSRGRGRPVAGSGGIARGRPSVHGRAEVRREGIARFWGCRGEDDREDPGDDQEDCGHQQPKLIALELEPPYPLYFLATSLTSLTLPRWRNQKMASIPAETKGTPPDTKRRAGGTLR